MPFFPKKILFFGGALGLDLGPALSKTVGPKNSIKKYSVIHE